MDARSVTVIEWRRCPRIPSHPPGLVPSRDPSEDRGEPGILGIPDMRRLLSEGLAPRLDLAVARSAGAPVALGKGRAGADD